MLNLGLKVTRWDLNDYPFEKEDPRFGNEPTKQKLDHGWIEYHGHLRPDIFGLCLVEEAGENTARPFWYPWSSVLSNYLTIKGPQPNFLRPLKEYAALEKFCEQIVGPSAGHRLNDGKKERSRPFDKLSESLMSSSDEVEALEIIRKIIDLNEYPLHWMKDEKFSWCKLNFLYPNLEERLARIKQFQDNWFSEEIIKGSKTFENSRKWLQTLED